MHLDQDSVNMAGSDIISTDLLHAQHLQLDPFSNFRVHFQVASHTAHDEQSHVGDVTFCHAPQDGDLYALHQKHTLVVSIIQVPLAS